MYVSEKKFIETCIDTGIDAKQLFEYTDAALSLIKKYGSGVYAPSIYGAIYSVDEAFGEYLLLLRHAEKATPKVLKQIVYILQKFYDVGQGGVVVKAPKETFTKKQRDAVASDVAVEQEELHETGLMVQSQGKIYKRVLSNDVEKLLS